MQDSILEITHIPFETEDLPELVGKAIVRKETGDVFLIIGYNSRIKKLVINGCFIDAETLFKEYTFLHGDICGKRTHVFKPTPVTTNPFYKIMKDLGGRGV